MNGKLTLLIFVGFLMFSCKKEEQSCSDGIFSPDKEEEMDCGGVCPPCNFEPTVVNSFLSTKVNGEPVSFATFTLVKSPDWILSFENDSINIQVNLGQGDSLGGRPMNVLYSSATYNAENHPVLADGYSVFAKVDHVKNELSGFFNAKFVSDNNTSDTLRLSDGEFQNVQW